MGGRFGIKRCIFLLLALLLLYLSLYTWNLRTGYLDALATNTGMEVAGLVLKPGKWVGRQITDFWDRYVYFVGLRQQNDELSSRLARLHLENAELREQARKAGLLERLLEFSPPSGWERQGTRVVVHRMGPLGALETLLVDKGLTSGIKADTPAITPDGVVGRVLKTGATCSTILLLTDPNSRIAVRGQKNRTTGVLVGQGDMLDADDLLSELYVPLNAPLEEGEILVTSGLDGIFPPGLPVARIQRIERSDISLFQTVLATPIAQVREVEDLLLLTRIPGVDPNLAVTVLDNSTGNATGNATGKVKGNSTGTLPKGARR
ncbi:MAG: rod shape-determining protein MreC [Desulfovibrio sp.]|uniref:rod shape-determining protein MreC n=1 Tax=Desulfovibrio sp. 7SRBS1 TaxID=3378064 RepID=UPI003B40E907